jgi:peptidoglycan/LPS O-acetylase OafA/YrhL
MQSTAVIPRRPGVARFLEPYRRITSSGQFIPEIDGLRFIAIFSVFVYHLTGDVLRHSAPGLEGSELASNWLFSVTQILNMGVPLFFVISGFILSLPFAEPHRNLTKPVSLKKYFLRRVTRLEPPYFLCLVLFFVLKVAGGRGAALTLLPNLVASLFYVHNPIFGRPSDINFVAWSLEIEIQFYILAPLLASVFAIRGAFARRFVLIALLALTTGASQLVSGDPRLELTLLGYAQYFLAGFLLAEFYLSRRPETESKRIWDFVSVGGWLLLLALLVRGGALIAWLAPAMIFVLYVAAFQGVAIRRVVTNRWITTVGGMCYTIYLLHNYAIATVGRFTERVSPGGPFAIRLLIQFVLISPIVLAVCALYFRFIERPCMRPDWIQRLRFDFLRGKAGRRFASSVQ